MNGGGTAGTHKNENDTETVQAKEHVKTEINHINNLSAREKLRIPKAKKKKIKKSKII